jgi:hypothetical protein
MVEAAKEILPDVDFKVTRRRIPKKYLAEKSRNVVIIPEMSPKNHFKTKVFDKIIDVICDNMESRGKIYQEVFEVFGFLIDASLNDSDLKSHVDILVKEYPEDIDETILPELKHLHAYLKTTGEDENIKHNELFKILHQGDLQDVFPNTYTILKIF